MSREAGQLRIAVLGSLHVWRDERPLELGAAQQRLVLSVLALQAGKPVGREQLKAALWGDSAPTYAVNVLQKHMSGLRRALEPDSGPGGRSITWTDAGYVLDAAPEAVDVIQFEHGVRAGHAARAQGDVEEAARRFHAALDLWRGPLAEGLSCAFLADERRRLDDARAEALVERVELDLQLGRHGALVPEVRQLVAEHPFQERLRAALMLALYRSGRAGEALTAYHDARRELADELGIDPSPELQHLYGLVLSADPALHLPPDGLGTTPHRTEPLPPAPPAPAQLPHRPPSFSGRADALRALDAALAPAMSDDPRTAIVVIAGGAGMGKTTLALEWAHRVKAHFPDGQLFVNLRGFDPTGLAVEPGEAVRGFLDAFEVRTERLPASVEGQAGLFRSIVADRRVLVVLDNVHDVEQVRHVLPGSPGSFVIVTARSGMVGLVSAFGAVPVVLNLPDHDEAWELLARRLGAARLDAEPEATAQIIAACSRLPLALSIVAARAASRPDFQLTELAAELREAHGSLDAFDGGDATTDVRRIFSWSYARLSDRAARLFRRLGLHAGPEISTEAAALLGEQSLPVTRAVLTELARSNLLREVRPSRFAMHDLIRSYAGELVDTTEPVAERRAAEGRLLDFYVRSAQRHDHTVNPERYPTLTLDLGRDDTGVVDDASDAMTWFATERAVLLAVAKRALETGHDAHAFQLGWSLATYLDRCGHFADVVSSNRDALQAARRMGDRWREAYAHRGIARGHSWLGQFDQAVGHFDAAVRIFDEVGDVSGAAFTHRSRAWALEREQRFDDAKRETLRALELFRAAGPRSGLAETLNALGWFEALLGDPDSAVPHCLEALAIAQEIGNRDCVAHTWDSLGFAHQLRGQLDESVTAYLRADLVWTEIGERWYRAGTLVRLGEAYLAADRFDHTATAWARALTIFDELQHPDAENLRRRLHAVEKR